jgi:hypothetical protein
MTTSVHEPLLSASRLRRGCRADAFQTGSAPCCCSAPRATSVTDTGAAFPAYAGRPVVPAAARRGAHPGGRDEAQSAGDRQRRRPARAGFRRERQSGEVETGRLRGVQCGCEAQSQRRALVRGTLAVGLETVPGRRRALLALFPGKVQAKKRAKKNPRKPRIFLFR